MRPLLAGESIATPADSTGIEWNSSHSTHHDRAVAILLRWGRMRHDTARLQLQRQMQHQRCRLSKGFVPRIVRAALGAPRFLVCRTLLSVLSVWQTDGKVTGARLHACRARFGGQEACVHVIMAGVFGAVAPHGHLLIE